MKTILRELFQQKRGVLLTILVLLILNLVTAFTVSWYQIPLLAASRNTWSELRRKSALAGRADAETLYRQATVDLDALSRLTPARREFPRILSDLIDSAKSCGVVMGPITYKPVVVKGQNLLHYQLVLTVSGSYAATKSFLAEVQKNKELIVIDGIGLSNSSPFEESVTLDMHISLFLREAA